MINITEHSYNNFSKFIFDNDCSYQSNERLTLTIGIIEGEGIGPDLLKASLNVLAAVETITSHSFNIQYSNYVGFEQNKGFKDPLDAKLIDFCQNIFSLNGAILAGPGGGRFVYNLRPILKPNLRLLIPKVKMKIRLL